MTTKFKDAQAELIKEFDETLEPFMKRHGFKVEQLASSVDLQWSKTAFAMLARSGATPNHILGPTELEDLLAEDAIKNGAIPLPIGIKGAITLLGDGGVLIDVDITDVPYGVGSFTMAGANGKYPELRVLHLHDKNGDMLPERYWSYNFAALRVNQQTDRIYVVGRRVTNLETATEYRLDNFANSNLVQSGIITRLHSLAIEKGLMPPRIVRNRPPLGTGRVVGRSIAPEETVDPFSEGAPNE